jgi:hypothetical protein
MIDCSDHLMQKRREIIGSQEPVTKPALLCLTTAIVVGIIAPLVIPHVSHPEMIYHIILHLAGISVAAFLVIVSWLAYRRVGGTRMLLMNMGFMAVTMAEILYFLDVTGTLVGLHVPTSDIEISHIILFAMLALFGLGVLKSTNNNSAS